MAKIFVAGSYAESLLRFRGHLLQDFLSRGHEVIACSPDSCESVQDVLHSWGVAYRRIRLSRTGLNPLKDIRSILHYLQIFRDSRPDWVLLYTIKPVIYGSIAARLAGVRHVCSMITGLGYIFTATGFKGRVLRVLVKWLYKFALRNNEMVFFQNIDDLNTFKNMRLLSEKTKISLIHGSGVDIDYFQVTQFPETLSFLLIARLIKDKGVREYVEAAREIKRKYPHIKFRLVGWRDENPTALSEEEISSWSDSGLIEFLGKVDDVRPAIAASSVYVLPSYGEGMPRTVLEAMAMGRPVISTDVPGCRQTVLDRKNGYLVPVRSVHDLAHAMENFILNPDLIMLMGKESRRIAEERYDVHKINAVILEKMNMHETPL